MTFNTKLLAGTLSLVLVAGMTSPAFAGVPSEFECVITVNPSIDIQLQANEVSEPIPKFIQCNDDVVDIEFDDTCVLNQWDAPDGEIGVDFIDFIEVITNLGDTSTEHCQVEITVIGFDEDQYVLIQDIWINSQKVAGELLPLDSTALVLAGLSSMTPFMIPAVAGLVGAGIYLVKFRSRD